MNRRNFILGLGTAATLSGAASVTGASISGTAEAGASFAVIAENELIVRRNTDTFAASGEIANDTDDNYVNTTVDFVDTEGTINNTIGSGVENVSSPQLTVDDGENAELNIGLATPNDAGVDGNTNTSTTPFNGTAGSGTPPLEIVNNGSQNKTISVEYDYSGTDVTTTDGSGTIGNDSLDATDVATLFTFSIGGQQISPGADNPDASGDQSTNTFQEEITSGSTAKVDFTLNFSSDLVNDIEAAASGGSDYNFADSGFASVNPLNAVTFGEVDSP